MMAGRIFLLALAFLIGASLAAVGEPLTPSSQQQTSPNQSDAQDESSYNGQDFTRPTRSVETRFEYRPSSGPTSRVDREQQLLKTTSKIDLNAQWKLGLLAQVPLVDKTTTSFEPPNFDNETGIGDTTFQGALIRTIDRNWAAGVGLRLVSPTARDAVGSGKWQIMPGFGVRYSFTKFGPDTYFVPVIRYAISFAGDPTRRRISEPQIAPTLNIGLPNRWFVTFYPSNDIRINFGQPIAGQTGRLFLPLDVALGKKFSDDLISSIELSVPLIKDYPVYDFKTELRVMLLF